MSLIIRTVLIALALTHSEAASAAANLTPNIVFILADDLGIGDISPTNPDCKIRTPHLRKMADEGLTFLDAHTSSSVCTPTRYGLLTGRYNWRSRLTRGIVGQWERPLIEDSRLTLPEMLRARGYDTADGALLWQVDLAGEGGIQQYVNSQQPVFTPDSLTAYFPTAFLSDVGFSYVYAVDLSLDLDIDGDGVIDLDDNCVAEFNPDQADGDDDGIGDVCDTISDACTWAIDLCPGTITGSTVDQTNDGASSCNDFPALNKDIWYA